MIYDTTFEQRNLSFMQSIFELCPVEAEDIGEYNCHAVANEMMPHTIPFSLLRVGGTVFLDWLSSEPLELQLVLSKFMSSPAWKVQ